MFLQALMQSTSITDRDQIESYISSSIKNEFARVSVIADCGRSLVKVKVLIL